jgi:hypothetical protein
VEDTEEVHTTFIPLIMVMVTQEVQEVGPVDTVMDQLKQELQVLLDKVMLEVMPEDNTIQVVVEVPEELEPVPAGQPNGGIGIQDDILGTAYYWAGGGGGASYSLSTGGNGGAGGGGGGALGTTTGGSGLNNGSAGGGGSPNSQTNRPGGNAGANTGGGGGGGSHYNSNNKGGDGGSGIVVIRYEGDPVFTGGTITTVDGDTVHTFLESGTLTPA